MIGVEGAMEELGQRIGFITDASKTNPANWIRDSRVVLGGPGHLCNQW